MAVFYFFLIDDRDWCGGVGLDFPFTLAERQRAEELLTVSVRVFLSGGWCLKHNDRYDRCGPEQGGFTVYDVVHGPLQIMR